MQAAWRKGYSDKTAEIEAIEREEAGQGFAADPKTKIPLDWGDADAAQYHRLKGLVSGVITDQKLKSAISASLVEALAQGISFSKWRKTLGEIFARLGYTPLSPWAAEKVFRTETSLAYGAGSYARQVEMADAFPYWEYSTVGDARVRPSHRALDGRVFRATDSEFYPPLGPYCRCRAIPISRRQAAKRGITEPDTVTPKMRADLNKRFIGDKIRGFEAYLAEHLKTLSADRAALIIEKLTEMAAEAKRRKAAKSASNPESGAP